MNDITEVKAEIQNSQPITRNLFNQFVNYIDRSPKTTATYLTNLKQFYVWMLYSDIKRPQRADILSYRDYLSETHKAIKLDGNSPAGWNYQTDKSGNVKVIQCSPATVKQYLDTVKVFFKWTAAEGIYPNVAENIHTPKIRNDVHAKESLEPADVLTIEKSIAAHAESRKEAAATSHKDAKGKETRADIQGKRLNAMYQLAVNAGLRTIELSRANVKDVETRNGQAYIFIYGKGHSQADQKKPIAAEVYAAIKDYLDSRTDAYNANSPLFVSTGNRSNGKRIAARTISQMLKQAMKDAGYNSEKLTAHSLRHTAGTNVMELSGNLYETQNYMRHKNPATTEIYLHCETEKQDACLADQLYNLYHGKQTNEKEQLQDILTGLNTEQLKQLVTIAAAMAK